MLLTFCVFSVIQRFLFTSWVFCKLLKIICTPLFPKSCSQKTSSSRYPTRQLQGQPPRFSWAFKVSVEPPRYQLSLQGISWIPKVSGEPRRYQLSLKVSVEPPRYQLSLQGISWASKYQLNLQGISWASKVSVEPRRYQLSLQGISWAFKYQLNLQGSRWASKVSGEPLRYQVNLQVPKVWFKPPGFRRTSKASSWSFNHQDAILQRG